ncbi:MAG TPA: hypothetical protein VMU04_12220 [Candidatus Acidoferrum sp.]|nr:hypothetical protein [Candidatus Acidoferrum sp.]
MPKVSILVLLGSAACLAVLIGCRTRTTYGTVYVSHPQVFTRERLVAAREKELQFLNNSLNAPVPFTLQGASDARELSAFQNSLGLTLSPTAGTSVAAASAPALSDLSKLQPASPESLALATNLSITSVDHFKDVMAYRDAVNAVIREKELDDTHDREGHTLYTLKFDTALIPGDNSTRAALVKIRITQPELASEDVAEIYRVWLQDLEARRGEEERAIASRFSRGQVTSADEALLLYLKDGMDDLTESARREITNSNIGGITNWIIAAGELTVDVLTRGPESRLQRLKEIMSYCPPPWEPAPPPASGPTNQASGAGPPAEATNRAPNVATNEAPTKSALALEKRSAPGLNQRDLLLAGMEMALNAKYLDNFRYFAGIQYSIDQISDRMTATFGHISDYRPQKGTNAPWWMQRTPERARRAVAEGLVNFSNVLRGWTNSVYVDSVDPQVYAQNISDVSSQTKALELALSVNAAIAKPASLSDTMKYLHQTQEFLEAIKRQPLALGFADGQEFGWFLGPAFGISESGKATFVHSANRQSFSVSIVVPAWVKNLALSVTNCWLDGKGGVIEKKMVVNAITNVLLPRDMDALTSAILRQYARPAPTLYLAEQVLQASTNGDQTLLIRGRELWRNPAVLVGSTPADAVDLLPDMRGLVAHFKSIPATYEPKADLTVVTSFGADALEKAVEIIAPSKAPTKPPPSARLTNYFAVNGGQPLGFVLSSMPAAFAGFAIQLSTKDTPGKWQPLADSDYRLTNRAALTIPIKVTNPPAPGGPVVYTLDLGLRLTPDAAPASLFPGTNKPTFVYFPVSGQEKPQVPPTTITYNTAGKPDTTSIKLTPLTAVSRAHLYQAYPGLEKSVDTGNARLSLADKPAGIKAPRALAVQEAPNGGTGWMIPIANLSTNDLPKADYNAFSLGYRTPDGNSASVDFTGGPISVKGP